MKKKISRTDFTGLILLQFFWLIIAITFLACKKENSTPEKFTIEVSGKIKTTEIGGQDLNVQSVYKTDCSVENDDFSTSVSTKGTQLLFIIDENDEIRGLTLSTILNGNSQIMESGALSTAYSLLLLSSGITTFNPDTTKKVLDKLSSMESFQSFVLYLKGKLLTQSITKILSDKEAISKMMNCILDYSGLDTIPENKGKGRIDDPDPHFEVLKTANPATVQLKNFNWRCVNVYRRDYKQDGTQVGNVMEITNTMNGGTPLSWGSLLSGALYEPTVIEDATYSQLGSEVVYCEYWVTGPSNGDCYYPSGIPQDITKQNIGTVMNYHIYAVIELLCGGIAFTSGSPEQTMKLTAEVAQELSSYAGIVTASGDILNAHSYSSQLKVWLDLFTATWGPAVNYLITHGAITGTAGVALGKTAALAGWLSLVMTGSNSTVSTIKCFQTPIMSKYVIYTDNVVRPQLQTPIQGYVTSSLTPTLTCQVYSGAMSYNFQVATESDFQNPIFNVNSSSCQQQIAAGILSAGNQYFWRVRVTTMEGQVSPWSDVWSFSTFSNIILPTLTTLEISNITVNSAQSGGNITEDGGGLVSERGVCWSTSQNPVYTGNHTSDGSGIGSFTSNITGLLANTLYYVRAYATNCAGIGYGNQIGFTTFNAPPSDVILPLAVGNYWTYLPDITPQTMNISITGTIEVQGETCYKWYAQGDPYEWYYKNNSDGCWAYGYSGTEQYPPDLEYKYPANAGDTWVTNWIAVPFPTTMTCESTSATFESYSGCYKYHFLMPFGKDNFCTRAFISELEKILTKLSHKSRDGFDIYQYFMPGIGLVGWEVYYQGTYMYKVVLTEYHLN